MKDDPDFPVALGSDGIATKLNIKNQSRMFRIEWGVAKSSICCESIGCGESGDVDFMPFQYQLSPTLPVRKDGPSNAIIVILSSVIGGMLACGYILLRHAMEARKMSVIE